MPSHLPLTHGALIFSREVSGNSSRHKALSQTPRQAANPPPAFDLLPFAAVSKPLVHHQRWRWKQPPSHYSLAIHQVTALFFCLADALSFVLLGSEHPSATSNKERNRGRHHLAVREPLVDANKNFSVQGG